MDFGALRELARLGKRGRRSPAHQRDGENERDCDFHENPPACTSVQVIPVTWGGGLRSETRRWRADLATASGRVPCLATHDNGVERGTEAQHESPRQAPSF